MNEEGMTENDNVFQLLDLAYKLLLDNENPLKVIRMAMFISILESHHQGKTKQQIKNMYHKMIDKFMNQYPPKKTHIDFGSE